ncbi:MAG: HAD family phosphatase [Nitrososphaeria archaeon]|jgi:HAD superfamily hydrolase (TIGR01509 family)
MIRAVIFDFDGVIADSDRAEFESFRQAFQKYGVTLTLTEFLESRGGTSLEIIGIILKKKRIRLSATEICEAKQKIYEIIIPGIKPFDEIIGLINRLENYKLAVASSGSTKNIEKMILKFGVRDKFDAVVGSEDIRRGKPDPEVFLLAARKLKTLPKNCLVIEDSLVGFKAARKAGMECIILSGKH